LFVRLGRESVTVDPTASATGQVVKLSDSQQREIQSVIDIMRSDYLLERVVDDLGPERILTAREEGAKKPSPFPWLDQAMDKVNEQIPIVRDYLADFKLADPSNPRAKAIQHLGKRVKISSEEQSNVITMRVRAESPKLSQEIATKILEGFQDRHIQAHRSEGAYGFFVDQSELAKKALDEKEVELRDAKNYAGFTSVGDQRAVLTERLKRVELGLLDALSELEGMKAKTQDYNQALGQVPERIESQAIVGLTNTSRDAMRGQLYDLENQLSDLRSKMKEDHPLVVKKKDQLNKAKELYADERVAPQVTTAVNAVHQEIKVAYLLGQADGAASNARIRELKDQREQILTEISDLNSKEIVIGDLEREIQVLDNKYRRYIDSLEQARIDEALQQDRLSSINVIQSPSFNDDAVDLSNSLIAVGGLCLSALAGCAMAFLSRYWRNNLTNVADVERELELPVLAAIPFSRPKRLKLS
jgi:uncharacterized protein involved in exopolysaccharide biosynthesis